ncbi:unnamed protein product [Effrenium voratum]|nr:unnamed protein product [Effrenium voratum]
MAGFFPWPACHLPSCPCVTRIRYGGMAEAALHSPYHGQGGRRTRHLELRRRVLIEGKVGQRADENRRQCKEFGAARFLDQVIEPFLLEKGFVATSPGNAPGKGHKDGKEARFEDCPMSGADPPVDVLASR